MHAPPPWNIEFSGSPGSNGELNMYVTDKDGRKIAAVWGKRGEKELTATLMSLAPDLLEACKLLEAYLHATAPNSNEEQIVRDAIARAEASHA